MLVITHGTTMEVQDTVRPKIGDTIPTMESTVREVIHNILNTFDEECAQVMLEDFIEENFVLIARQHIIDKKRMRANDLDYQLDQLVNDFSKDHSKEETIKEKLDNNGWKKDYSGRKVDWSKAKYRPSDGVAGGIPRSVKQKNKS